MSRENGSENTGLTNCYSSKAFIAYESVAAFAFVGNILVCILFIKKRNLLKKTYNIFFLLLAVADLLSSVILAVTALFVVSQCFPFPVSDRAAEIMCRLIWSRWLLYSLGVLSVYLCLLLTVERWLAVVKPLHNQGDSKRRRVTVSLIMAIFLAFGFSASSPFDVVYLNNSPSLRRCAWRPNSGAWGVVQYLGQALIPSVAMIALVIHMILKTRGRVAPLFDLSERRNSNTGARTSQTQKTVIKMIGTASFFMILCWLPNQTFYLLAKFELVKFNSDLHYFLEILTFFNSGINPAIYGITNKTFRKSYWEIMLAMCPARVRARLEESRGELADNFGSVIFLVHAIHRRKSYDWRVQGVQPSPTVATMNPSSTLDCSNCYHDNELKSTSQ